MKHAFITIVGVAIAITSGCKLSTPASSSIKDDGDAQSAQGSHLFQFHAGGAQAALAFGDEPFGSGICGSIALSALSPTASVPFSVVGTSSVTDLAFDETTNCEENIGTVTFQLVDSGGNVVSGPVIQGTGWTSGIAFVAFPGTFPPGNYTVVATPGKSSGHAALIGLDLKSQTGLLAGPTAQTGSPTGSSSDSSQTPQGSAGSTSVTVQSSSTEGLAASARGTCTCLVDQASTGDSQCDILSSSGNSLFASTSYFNADNTCNKFCSLASSQMATIDLDGSLQANCSSIEQTANNGAANDTAGITAKSESSGDFSPISSGAGGVAAKSDSDNAGNSATPSVATGMAQLSAMCTNGGGAIENADTDAIICRCPNSSDSKYYSTNLLSTYSQSAFCASTNGSQGSSGGDYGDDDL